MRRRPADTGGESDFAITDAGYARFQGDSFLTFPEWYIVHAYNDLAGVTARSSESAFDYLASIRGFWTSLCGATRQASESGPASADQKMTNYIIGFSFTAEMGLMGTYERTIGALTAWTAGGRKTAEDEFNLTLLKEYGAFLYQTPWFRFAFGAKLRQFWRETPFVPSIRAVERRGSLSLQYAARYAYAALMRFVAGYDPADLTIRSVVGGLAAAELKTMPGVKVLREVGGANGVNGVLVETARYADFDAFVRELGRHPKPRCSRSRAITTSSSPSSRPRGLMRQVGGSRRRCHIPASGYSLCPAHGVSASTRRYAPGEGCRISRRRDSSSSMPMITETAIESRQAPDSRAARGRRDLVRRHGRCRDACGQIGGRLRTAMRR